MKIKARTQSSDVTLKPTARWKQIVILGALAASLSCAGITLAVLSPGDRAAEGAGPDGGRGAAQQGTGARPGRSPAIAFTPTFTIFLPAAVNGRAYYVSTGGDDGNDGLSRSSPFRTIARALEVVRPGEGILILPGVYHEALTLENFGSAGRTITIGGEEGAILDGQRTRAIGFWCENCTNLAFQNLEIRNYTDVGIGAYLSLDVEMRDLTVHDNGFDSQLAGWEIEGYGIHVDVCSRISVEGCDVYRNGPDPRPFGVLGTGINTYGCTDCVIRDNHSYENVGGGILVEDSVNVLVDGNLVNANYLDATEDEWWDGGIWVDGGHTVTVTGNTFQDNLGPGIQISDEDNQDPYGYVLEGNVSSENYYGIYIWNFGSAGYPPESVLRMTGNQIISNTVQDVWIVP